MLTDLIKITFAKLNKAGILATPDMYRKYFCEEARKIGLYNSECNSIGSLADSLSYKNKQKLKKLDIETMDQLLDFLNVHLEGTGKCTDAKEIEAVSENKNLEDFIGLVEIVKDALLPSIGNLYCEDMDIINEKIAAHPELISDKQTQDTIHKLVQGRADFDRRSIVGETIELTDITSNISKSINKSIEVNKIGSNKMTQVLRKLNNLEKVDFTNKKQTNMLKNQFILISGEIESEANRLSTYLSKENKSINVITNKISNIQSQIKNVGDKRNLDFLTNTYTKIGFNEILNEVEEKFTYYKEDYCFILYDLDRLDKINKVYGFDAGDRVISVFAHLLMREFNDNGAVGRYGGNKFLLVLYDNLEAGIKYANHILNVLHNVQFTYRNETMKVTLSGAVCSRLNTDSQDIMLNNVQELLQKAKENGRNRIEICALRSKQNL